MSEPTRSSGSDSVVDLLIAHGVRIVGLVDDVYDSLGDLNLRQDERDDLWGHLQDNDAALEELERLGHPVTEPGELTSSLLVSFDTRRAYFVAFERVWQTSTLGNRIESARAQVNRLRGQLEQSFGLEVRPFGSNTPAEAVVAEDLHLLFLDWYLGDDTPTSIEAAVQKVTEILSSWPADRAKPLIVLMSSHPGLREHADDFCHRSGILRGMFYAVPKRDLADNFKLRLNMHLFAMSLPAARSLQSFVDGLRAELPMIGERFVDRISDLTLSDYAFIHSFSLQDDGQPLGDYLLWLFSAYFGHLLFAEALSAQRAQLDAMTFSEALPSPGPPSERLTQLYHYALFDTEVGPAQPHPWATPATGDQSPDEPLALTLGDVFERRRSEETSDLLAPRPLDKRATDSDETSSDSDEPDLFMVINAQCDLAFTPNLATRAIDPDRSILLLPGRLESVRKEARNRSMPKTELYLHERGSYRIVWNTKGVTTVPYGSFKSWQKEAGFQRVARLRLPFALEVQRAFAADLTRVGMPVMPPIFQPIVARVLRANGTTFEETGELGDEEAAFLVLTRSGQRCVLTLPLIMRFKALLDERLATLRTALVAAGENRDSTHLPSQIESLQNAISNDREWATLRAPFDPPTPTKAQKFMGDRIQVVRGKKEGDTSDSRAVVAVSLDLDDTAS